MQSSNYCFCPLQKLFVGLFGGERTLTYPEITCFKFREGKNNVCVREIKECFVEWLRFWAYCLKHWGRRESRTGRDPAFLGRNGTRANGTKLLLIIYFKWSAPDSERGRVPHSKKQFLDTSRVARNSTPFWYYRVSRKIIHHHWVRSQMCSDHSFSAL